MMAAGIAAQNGKKVTLLEKNPILGKKLLITGKGRCNITNYCDVNDLVQSITVNGKFLINSLYAFSSYDVIRFFNELGLETKVERGNRVFPVSDKAKDVVKILIKFINKFKVEIRQAEVISVLKFGNLFAAKLRNGEVIRAKNLVIATGGKSYPRTGSTGDGYRFAQDFGHRVTDFKPSLVPISAQSIIPIQGETASRRCNVKDLAELTLKNVSIMIRDTRDKIIFEDFGEMNFTNFGVDGPIILSASSHIRKIKDYKLIIDLKPALSIEKLDKRLQRDFIKNSNKQFKSVLKNLLPNKLIPVIQNISGIPSDKVIQQITAQERQNLIIALKQLTIKLIKFRPISESIITSGGVDIKQIDPKTMESKLVPGLYFVGEVLNCDGYTGGFNLQIAWSSGYAAGISC